ncbi:uncharacterized membrane protein YcaP (DUF421 family) [Bacillus fengqiuensis]|nr:uncharacterized membrane protein YcaP (DUF421 family) [Bacillus fengqiuensis]
MEEVINASVRTVISFILLMLTTFLIGKQMNSHKNHFNLALSITLGSLIANMGFNVKIRFIPMLFSFLVLIMVYYLISIVSLKSRLLREWLSGRPTVVIDKGHILEANMRKLKYSLDDLNQDLRELGIFNVEEVEFALVESSGKLSVLKREQYQNVTKKDVLKTNRQPLHLPIELIMDGKLIEKNLTPDYNEEWIHQELNKRKLMMHEVFYAVINTNGQLFVDRYKDRLSSRVDIE